MDGSGSDITDGRDNSANWSDGEHGPEDYDMAIAHDRNAKLKDRPLVEKFFRDIQGHRSLEYPKTRSWLANLPFNMCDDAIPLFVDGDKSRDDSIDYQLHPCSTWLELDTTAVRPHKQLFCLMKDDEILETPNPVIGIGRLFVNAGNDTGGRTSKWTGYEVFVDRSLSLWIVFDINSNNPPASGWYPVPSRFCSENDEAPDIARLLPTLQDLAHATFEAARNTVKSTGMSGNMKVGLIAKEEVTRLFIPPLIHEMGKQLPATRQDQSSVQSEISVPSNRTMS